MSKKPHKHHSRKDTAFIHKNGGMDWEQYYAQKKNIEKNKRKKEIVKQKTGK